MAFSNDVWDTLTRVTSSATADGALSQLVAFLQRSGLENYTYTALNDTAEHAAVHMVSNLDPTFRAYYKDHRLDEHDPSVDRLKAQNHSPIFLGRNNPQWSPRLENGQKHLLDLAFEVGVGCGVGLVLPPPAGRPTLISGILVSTRQTGEAFRALWRERHTHFQLVINLAHQQTSAVLMRDLDDITPLSSRERDCLLLISQGHRVQRIAERLGIAEITVHVHLKKAREKLRSRTLPQAAAKAIRYGYMQP